MDTQPDELLRALIGILEKLELRYFVTGSVAAIVYLDSFCHPSGSIHPIKARNHAGSPRPLHLVR